MIKFIGILVYLLLHTTPTLADDYEDAVSQLLKSSGLLDQTVKATEARMKERLSGSAADDLHKRLVAGGKNIPREHLDGMLENYQQRVIARLPDEFRKIFTEAYRQVLTLQEVQELAALMANPVAAKYMRSFPRFQAMVFEDAGMAAGRIGAEEMSKIILEYEAR